MAYSSALVREASVTIRRKGSTRGLADIGKQPIAVNRRSREDRPIRGSLESRSMTPFAAGIAQKALELNQLRCGVLGCELPFKSVHGSPQPDSRRSRHFAQSLASDESRIR